MRVRLCMILKYTEIVYRRRMTYPQTRIWIPSLTLKKMTGKLTYYTDIQSAMHVKYKFTCRFLWSLIYAKNPDM